MLSSFVLVEFSGGLHPWVDSQWNMILKLTWSVTQGENTSADTRSIKAFAYSVHPTVLIVPSMPSSYCVKCEFFCFALLRCFPPVVTTHVLTRDDLWSATKKRHLVVTVFSQRSVQVSWNYLLSGPLW